MRNVLATCITLVNYKFSVLQANKSTTMSSLCFYLLVTQHKLSL